MGNNIDIYRFFFIFGVLYYGIIKDRFAVKTISLIALFAYTILAVYYMYSVYSI